MIDRHELEGIEFDWFAIDDAGHAAVFSTAGYGEIPNAALDLPVAPDYDAIEAEPIESAATGATAQTTTYFLTSVGPRWLITSS